MYEVKMEEVRVEIMGNMKEKANENDTMWMVFAKFLAECFLGLCRLIGIFFKGLWSFIKYAYYKLMLTSDKK